MTIESYQIGSDKWNGLSKLIEEMGELHQVCGKLIGSGGNTDHWAGDLRPKFIEEIGDTFAALRYFVLKNFELHERYLIDDQFNLKLNRFNQWDRDVRNKALSGA